MMPCISKTKSNGFDLSVIICTQNRAESLRETLTHLTAADHVGFSAEVIVVNNGGSDATPEVVRAFENLISIRYLFEPKQGVFGKSHALNRALGQGELGAIVAILDDDISPHGDWFRGVMAICERWPQKDLFTGRSYVIWPAVTPPALAQSSPLRTWMYSIIDNGGQDEFLRNGQWFSGNHFWFRSRCLESGVRFADCWLTEPTFMLDLVELGYEAVSGPDAVVGHRIQDGLLDRKVIRERAIKVGRSNAEVRLRPYRASVKHARFMSDHPLLGRLYCCAKLVQAGFSWLRSRLHLFSIDRFVATAIAIEKLAYHLELLRTASQMREYRVLRIFGNE
jgi:glycosyltransferase involved in cell wall biosynthesis